MDGWDAHGREGERAGGLEGWEDITNQLPILRGGFFRVNEPYRGLYRWNGIPVPIRWAHYRVKNPCHMANWIVMSEGRCIGQRRQRDER